MRTIKFRAFSPIINAMHEFDLEWYETAKNLGIEIDTLGQFTGLKDKNGKEIYEGDIVEQITIGDDPDPIPCIFEIKDIRNLTELYGSSKRNMVVGNIHENPELI